MPLDIERKTHCFGDLLGQVVRRLPGRQSELDHDELVSAEARDEVALAHQALQSDGHLLQEDVAHGMPERVVDLLEEIQIDQVKGKPLP